MPRVPRLHGWPVDIALVVAISAAGALETLRNSLITPKPAALACELAMGALLLLRRRMPLAVLLGVSAAGTAETLAGVPMDQPWVPLAAVMVATYTLVTRVELQWALVGMLGAALLTAVQVMDQHKGFGNFVFAIVFVAPIFMVARAMRVRADQADRHAEAEEHRASAAIEAERRRIARELHDVISHSLGLVVLQAGAAQEVLDKQPAKARELLESIRLTGLDAVGELGTLLSLVRSAPTDELEPAPRLADLDRLADRMREAGLAVELDIVGVRRALPAALELSAYRIVQEGLTNALKHAPDAQVRVRVSCSAQRLDIEVADSGQGAEARQPGHRQGLVGIGERVAVFGGQVAAGPAGEGWALRASLPLPS